MRPARNSQVLRTIPFLMVVCFICTATQAKYSGGTGEPNDPYQIATAEDLILLGESPEDYNKHFILTAEIDLDPNLPGRKVFDKAVIAPDTNDASWWFDGTSFKGVFDGNSHRILNLTIMGVDYLGLFGLLDSGAGVSNLGIEAIDVNGVGENIGGLAGMNSGSITSSYINGTIRGGEYVGGLIGENISDILIYKCFWDIETSGQTSSFGGKGKTTIEMHTADTFLKADWDFVGETENGTEDIWWIDEGNDYPRLWWETTGVISD